MATCRARGARFEFKVTRKHVLPAPGYVYFTFDDEAAGREYCERLEKLLDRGIVPEELLSDRGELSTIGQALEQYQATHSVSAADQDYLGVLADRIGQVKLSQVDYNWCERWVQDMKRERQLAPGTIRHYVGALARGFDWLYRKKIFLDNPLRMLPKGYSQYSERDSLEAGITKQDIERDRRLAPEEELRVREVLAGTRKGPGKQRLLTLEPRPAYLLLFEIAIESAMRLGEIFTLTRDQVDLEKRTIFLDKTKNGDKRQVPISSVLHQALIAYLAAHRVKRGERLFPFWVGESAATKKAASNKLTKTFARVFDHGEAIDFGFHDLRHEATSRLFERTDLSDLEIAKITGHKDLKMLRRYANLRGSTLADRLW